MSCDRKVRIGPSRDTTHPWLKKNITVEGLVLGTLQPHFSHKQPATSGHSKHPKFRNSRSKAKSDKTLSTGTAGPHRNSNHKKAIKMSLFPEAKAWPKGAFVILLVLTRSPGPKHVTVTWDLASRAFGVSEPWLTLYWRGYRPLNV